MATPKSAPAPASPNPSALTIDVTPSQEARQALELRTRASSLVIIDKASHTRALEEIQAAKQIRRKIVDHWARTKRAVDDLKKNLLTSNARPRAGRHLHRRRDTGLARVRERRGPSCAGGAGFASGTRRRKRARADRRA